MNKNEKCSTTQLGRKVIHKGNLEKRVYEDELDYYFSEGYELGASEKHRKNNSSSNKGRQGWNKGGHLNDGTKKKISQSLKGSAPWNKGLTAESDDRVKQNTAKSNQTKRNLYGCAFPNNSMTDEHKRKIGEANRGKHPRKLTETELEHKLQKQYETRKKNNSFNTSKPEEKLYNDLTEQLSGKTIYRNYKDKDRYPFYCDFYVVEDDLFIELNAHWTHGGKPFDPKDTSCLEQLSLWKEKAKTSQFYKNAIDTWTVRDVEKLQCAKEHNLNYKVIY